MNTMKRSLCIISAILISLASFSQSAQDSSGVSTSIEPDHQDEPIFTKAEKMPEVTVGVKVLEDTLRSNLSSEAREMKLKNLVYKLTITKEGSVRECVLVSKAKNKALAKKLESLLKQTSG